MRRITIGKGANGATRRALLYAPKSQVNATLYWFHGFQGRIENYSSFMERLASRGIAVVTPQTYEAGNFFTVPTPALEAAAAGEFVVWFETNKASYGLPSKLSVVLGGHSRGSQVALRLARGNPKAFRGVALFDPVDGLEQFGQTRIFKDNWGSFNLPALNIGTEYGSVTRLPRLACAPKEVNHEVLARHWGVAARHVVIPDSGHDDLLNEQVVAEETRNPLACQPGGDPSRSFARAEALISEFLVQAISPPGG